MEYINQLMLRTRLDWENSWGEDTAASLDDVFLFIARTMRHPNSFYLPTDNIQDVIKNTTGDMREVVVLLLLEDKLGVDLSEFEKFKMGDIFH